MERVFSERESKGVAKVAYDEQSRVITVWYRHGKKPYNWPNKSEQDYERVVNAPSIGSAVMRL